MLTCYHAHTAKLLDNHVDVMLVGDSLGMVMHGLEITLGVTLDMMITHAKAVMRGSTVPWSWWTCRSAAMRKARRWPSAMPPASSRKPAPRAVKMEGGTRMAETIHYLTPSAASQ